MMYYGHCPYCGTVVRGGHGTPIKRIDTPVRTCHNCLRKYIDENMYEWAILDFPHIFYFYFFANNRWIPYFLFLIFAAGGYWLVTVIGTITWIGISYLWVRLTKEYAKMLSKKRCLEPGYVDFLLEKYSKADAKKCRQYNQEIARQHAIVEQMKKDEEEAERQELLREYRQRCKKCGHKLNALQVICDNCGEKR